MSGVISSSDVFAMQKLASGSVHGRTLPDSLFAKGFGKVLYHVPLLKILNVSKLPRRAVVPSRSKFAPANL